MTRTVARRTVALAALIGALSICSVPAATASPVAGMTRSALARQAVLEFLPLPLPDPNVLGPIQTTVWVPSDPVTARSVAQEYLPGPRP